MSRLASSRDVKRLRKVLQFVLRSKIFYERTKKKNIHQVFRQKNEGVVFDDGNFDGRNTSCLLTVLSEGEWIPYLFSVLKNMNYKLETSFRRFSELFSPEKQG